MTTILNQSADIDDHTYNAHSTGNSTVVNLDSLFLGAGGNLES